MVKHVGIDELLVDREYDSSGGGGGTLPWSWWEGACRRLAVVLSVWAELKKKRKKKKNRAETGVFYTSFQSRLCIKKAKSMA